MNNPALPRSLTSHDFLKMAAVLLMVIYNLGDYFYPEKEWLRAIGLWCVPIWFFLIGYANSRRLNSELWIGAGVLIAASILAGQALFPMSILVTIILVRFTLDMFMEVAVETPRNFWMLSAVMMLLILPTIFLFEYGTEGFLLAMVGYLTRNKEKVSGALLDLFMLFAFLIFVMAETLISGFGQDMVILMSAGIVAVFIILHYFQPVEFPKLTKTLPVFVTKSVQLFGRHTLLIYVGHLVLFKIAMLFVFPERFQLFNWSMF